MEYNLTSFLTIKHMSLSNNYLKNNKGISPKHSRIGKDLEETEVEALFGTCIDRNGYMYCHSNNEELMAHVETLWMQTHQSIQVPHTCMTNEAEAHDIV
jgi:hypothetical protein